MQQGDLVYIPQDVNLWNYTDNGSMNVIKTDKPITGVFLKEEMTNTYRVYAQGREATVEKRHVYPMEIDNVS
tara:strand:+ start:213 stop:428 length:216 start_codon:yes stop_codon:yes gene_type:complete